MRVREAHNSSLWKGNGIGLKVKGDPNEGPPQNYPRPNLLSPPAGRDSPRPRRLGRGGI